MLTLQGNWFPLIANIGSLRKLINVYKYIRNSIIIKTKLHYMKFDIGPK